MLANGEDDFAAVGVPRAILGDDQQAVLAWRQAERLAVCYLARVRCVRVDRGTFEQHACSFVGSLPADGNVAASSRRRFNRQFWRVRIGALIRIKHC